MAKNLAQIDRELSVALAAAGDDWNRRKYVQGAAWTRTNEERRERAVGLIVSLLNSYNEWGRFTEKQRVLVRKLIANAKKG